MQPRGRTLKSRTGTQAEAGHPQQLQHLEKGGDAQNSRMPRLFLSHLLAVCLLLSQLPAEIHGQRKKPKNTDVVKLCGSELAVYWIRLCGNLNWDRMALSPTEPGLTSGPLAGESSRPWPVHISHWWLPSSCRPIGNRGAHCRAREPQLLWALNPSQVAWA